ncbi:hypothetical protein ACFWU5_18445 [Nocardia sp. NPDC058640]|uniref:hypothetical protein n=1 Tax=Nocardia sp. NPDC058640 TaxID=3346571 RepID=UPI003656519A
MTRELPFDDGAARTEGPDTAYRVANGVARVARAGAYVTGGALVAANGAARDSNADSRYAGWSQQTVPTDPSPDAPSPIVTFPDLAAPEFDPVVPPAPFFAPPDVSMVARTGEFDRRPETSGSDERDSRIPGDNDSSSGIGIPGYNPGYGHNPGNAEPGFDLPGFDDRPEHGTRPGFDLPDFGRPGFDQPGFDQPGIGLPGFDGPTPGIGIPGYDSLPGNDFGIPGYSGIGLPGTDPVGSVSDGMFDGIGDLGGMFDGIGAMMTSQWQVDVHAGLDGVWFTSQLKADLQVGDVGDQLDDYSDWLRGEMTTPGGTGTPSPTGGLSSPNGPTLPGSSSGVGLPGSTAPVPAPVAATPFVPTPAPTPAPIAPAPAPIAPVAVAPLATNPVVSTPLQTTIQPDAASTPIANVFGPATTSPLTAPAASVPALFTPVTPTKPVVLPDVSGGGSTPTMPPVTVPSKVPTIDLETPTTVKPVVPTVTVPTVPDGTKVPITVPPTTPVKPTVPDDDVTTKPGTGGSTTPSTGQGTPTVDVPTPTKPPTVDVDPPTTRPTVDIDPPVVTPPPVTVAPTVAPVKPPVVETKPIAAEFDQHSSGYHGVSAGLFDSGLGGGDVLAGAFPVEHHGYDFV